MDVNYKNDVIEIDVIDIFWLLIKKAWMILVCAIIFAVGTFFALNISKNEVYISRGSIIILNLETKEHNQNEISFNNKVVSDCKEILTSRTIVEQMIGNLGMPSSYEQVVGNIEVSEVKDTRILEINVTATTPQQAKAMLDELQKVSITHIEEIFEMCTVKVVDDGNLPTVPESNDSKVFIIIAFGLGAILAIMVIVIRYLMDCTVKTEKHIETYLHCMTLGCVSSKKSDEEAYKVLRTNIKATKDDLTTLLITNCGNADVVNNISLDLIKAYEDGGKKAVYVMSGTQENDNLKNCISLSESSDEKIAEELERLKEENDIVIIGIPEIHKRIDAAIVASQCDATIVVVEKGKTHYQILQDVMKQLVYVKANVIGCVIDNG